MRFETQRAGIRIVRANERDVNVLDTRKTRWTPADVDGNALLVPADEHFTDVFGVAHGDVGDDNATIDITARGDIVSIHLGARGSVEDDHDVSSQNRYDGSLWTDVDANVVERGILSAWLPRRRAQDIACPLAFFTLRTCVPNCDVGVFVEFHHPDARRTDDDDRPFDDRARHVPSATGAEECALRERAARIVLRRGRETAFPLKRHHLRHALSARGLVKLERHRRVGVRRATGRFRREIDSRVRRVRAEQFWCTKRAAEQKVAVRVRYPTSEFGVGAAGRPDVRREPDVGIPRDERLTLVRHEPSYAEHELPAESRPRFFDARPSSLRNRDVVKEHVRVWAVRTTSFFPRVRVRRRKRNARRRRPRDVLDVPIADRDRKVEHFRAHGRRRVRRGVFSRVIPDSGAVVCTALRSHGTRLSLADAQRRLRLVHGNGHERPRVDFDFHRARARLHGRGLPTIDRDEHELPFAIHVKRRALHGKATRGDVLRVQRLRITALPIRVRKPKLLTDVPQVANDDVLGRGRVVGIPIDCRRPAVVSNIFVPRHVPSDIPVQPPLRRCLDVCGNQLREPDVRVLIHGNVSSWVHVRRDDVRFKGLRVRDIVSQQRGITDTRLGGDRRRVPDDAGAEFVCVA
eukprot:31559-Pelagococcus_subviridis.AAC.8